jgi:Xaa-Pro aminopeptidase
MRRMSVLLPNQGPEVFAASPPSRGRPLGPGQAALVCAGDLVPRNYAANIFPYRAHSHFLYLTGLQWPGAVLLGAGDEWEIFAEPPAADDALWIGPSPGWDELAAAAGVRAIQPLADLPITIAARGVVATVPPSLHPRTRAARPPCSADPGAVTTSLWPARSPSRSPTSGSPRP